MSKNGSILNTRQRRAIAALLVEKSVADAAQTAGVGQSSIYRWLHNRYFVGELRKLEAGIIDQAARRLLKLQTQSLDTLEDLLIRQGVSDTDRRLAAQFVLSHLLKIREITVLEERIQAMEIKVYEKSI